MDETANQNPCTLNIYGQDSDDALSFTNATDNLTDRPLTTATAAWSPPDWVTVGESGPDQQTADISSVIQEIVDRPNYDSTSAIAIIISGTGKRIAESYNGSSGDAPTLCVTYGPATYDCPAQMANIGDPCDDGDPNTSGETIQTDCSCGGGSSAGTTTCALVTASSDDAEQKSNGSMSMTSSDLELIDDNTIQKVGMRFLNLNIPQGATINSASLQFTVDETDNVNPCNLDIYGQDSDDAATFTTSSNNIGSRPLTTATVSWPPPDWTTIGNAGPDQLSPDLAVIIQEIVDRPNYTAGSAIAIIIEGTGRRVAEAFDGSPTEAPELCVEYVGSAPLISLGKYTFEKQGMTNGKLRAEANTATDSTETPRLFTVYPNPTTGDLTVSFHSHSAQRVQIQVSNIQGAIARRFEKNAMKGANAILLEQLGLPSGIYFIECYLDGHQHVARFVMLSH